MRWLAIGPFLCCAASLVLAFLCLFAGSSKGFMEDYAVLTLNTSRIGQNIFNTSESSSSTLGQLIDNVTNSIESDIQDLITSTARDLGLHDFYSAHLMTYCEGYYKPGPVANATLSKDDISKNVTECSNRTAMYNFDPEEILQRELDESGTGVDLSDLDWPDDIQKGIDALRISAKATFVLYCIAIGFIGVAFLSAGISFFMQGRLSALINVILDWFAFVVLGIASAIATAIAVKASGVINEYGNDIGVSASKGRNFLTMTWVATGLLLFASILWFVDCCFGGRRKVPAYSAPKHG
ncbi:SUR7 family protein pun1 [Pseudocercospora fuligena]|uniref:SUR7 family protein pun1 n=1 Tax=Pseudocercospora fuligena TaxID=685502 RepID=A0A8H6VH15_9PEZI|nr:SUR7 family protein pun1 [Pseudocercospora fuligena]